MPNYFKIMENNSRVLFRPIQIHRGGAKNKGKRFWLFTELAVLGFFFSERSE